MAKEPRFTIMCTVKAWLRDYILLIALFLGLLVYAVVKIRRFCYNRRVSKVAAKLYTRVKECLLAEDQELA